MSATVVIVLITFAIVLGLIIWAIAKAQRQDRRAGEVESRRLFSWVKKIPKKTVFAVIAIALLLYGGYYFASCKGATQQITACPTHEEKFTLQPGEEKKVRVGPNMWYRIYSESDDVGSKTWAGDNIPDGKWMGDNLRDANYVIWNHGIGPVDVSLFLQSKSC